jgi:penicillin-binding protein 1A
LPVEVWTRFMRVAHQNVPVAPLPGSAQPQGGFLSGLFPGNSRAPAPTQQPYPQQTSNQGYLPPPPNGPAPNPQGRPPVTQTSARPEAASGLDGWLVDRLFGGRR